VFAALHRLDVGRGRSLQLLYVTPEKIVASEGFTRVLHKLHTAGKLNRFIIDEAHCVSQWGHDFRPDYVALSKLKHNFGSVPVTALTATATERVVLDVQSILGLRECATFTASFNRPNLRYHVRHHAVLSRGVIMFCHHAVIMRCYHVLSSCGDHAVIMCCHHAVIMRCHHAVIMW